MRLVATGVQLLDPPLAPPPWSYLPADGSYVISGRLPPSTAKAEGGHLLAARWAFWGIRFCSTSTHALLMILKLRIVMGGLPHPMFSVSLRCLLLLSIEMPPVD